ncbi:MULTISPECIES: metal-dependent hydrolase [Ensifer]|uniref:metal-dependent hydrolase n=2 Tax=Sinorhizobium/Ensifer group TaxID=227292 RepID=UPI0009CDCB48|nr:MULTISPECIES: metal-dependent hydrolase [Ensifer]MDP9634184.1 inner membrane protein [Ensifer adhaerens]NOV16168.1 metal-dependent hydrolase [Ensifer canadensis]OMQ39978.1 metal-dependent hydrolase [Ensifer sp. 1H6]PSS65477.1 metal-dependent hydrolase [Ensifer sp. NM-2]
MFVAHLPAGYLLSRFIARGRPTQSGAIIATGIVCSVLPDCDLAYFYLVDGRRTAHHDYWTHTPLFWLAAAAALALALTLSGRRNQLILVSVGLANVLLHLLLDSVAADIRWFHPLSDLRVNLVHVQALYKPWYLNFLFHWTFMAELLIVVSAAVAATLDWRRWRGRVAALPAVK